MAACIVSFFFNDTATTEIYTLSLHDALPICSWRGTATRLCGIHSRWWRAFSKKTKTSTRSSSRFWRSEEHTSELQSRQYLVCRLLLEKKKRLSKPHRLADIGRAHVCTSVTTT